MILYDFVDELHWSGKPRASGDDPRRDKIIRLTTV